MPEDQPLEEMASGTGVDYDLTQMNGDMVYATVYQMMADPSTYEGKTFRMEGLYTPIIVEDTGKRTMKTCIAALPMRPWKWCSKE